MHTVVEPQDIDRKYHTRLMLMNVHALGVLTYRWYFLFSYNCVHSVQWGFIDFPCWNESSVSNVPGGSSIPVILCGSLAMLEI
jgi:hypothetical protein